MQPWLFLSTLCVLYAFLTLPSFFAVWYGVPELLFVLICVSVVDIIVIIFQYNSSSGIAQATGEFLPFASHQ